MIDPQLLVWSLFAPPIAAGLASLLALLFRRGSSTRARTAVDVAALALACAGPLLQGILVAFASAGFDLAPLDLTLQAPVNARSGIISFDAALIFLLLFPGRDAGLASTWAVGVSGTLLAGALLLTDPLSQTFCLMGASLVVAAFASYPLPRHAEDAEEPALDETLRVAGSIKQAAISACATLLLVAGSLFIARFPFHMENAATLTAGAGLLGLGLAVRAGAMPFSGGASDLLKGSPRGAILALGAVVPAVLVAGTLMLAPLVPRMAEVSQAARWIALALTMLASLLAGLRALGAIRRNTEPQAAIPSLLAATAGVQIGWALFGILSVSGAGMAGAVLLAANLAITVPLTASANATRWPALVAAGSLLGLPPFGGFVGALLVASAAVQVGGPWLSLLLVGPIMAAIAWFRVFSSPETGQPRGTRYQRLYWCALTLGQVVLLVVSVPLAGLLNPG